ncbi:MAG: beta-class carbonic anhydrase [Candidatus Hodarchaeota archaeon]
MVGKVEELLIKGNMELQWKIKQDLEQVESNPKKVPKYPVLILTCMDPRIDIYRIFQLKPGDVFVLRNAGNLFTKDVLRSILIVIHEYNVRHIVVLGHIDCGMTKIKLNELKHKLTKPALAAILRNGTNIPIELQKFFKIFIDEIKNIKTQVEKIRKTLDIPSYVSIAGMLYDVNSSWVFEYEKFGKYNFVENFMRHYKEFIEGKKYDFIDYIESIEKEIIEIDVKPQQEIKVSEGSPLEDKIECNIKSKSEAINPEYIEINQQLEEFENIVETFKNVKLIMPKIQIPRIYIPKIKVTIPKIYKKEKK